MKYNITSNKTHPIFGCVLYLILPSIISLFLSDSITVICVVDFIFYLFALFYRNTEKIQSHSISVFPNYLKLCIIFCICCLLMTSYLWSKWYLCRMPDSSTETYINNMSNISVFSYLFMICIAAPIGEESLFRCLIIDGFSYSFRKFSIFERILFPVLLSSILFAIMHGTGVHIISGILCGLAFGLSYRITNRLSLSIGIHALYNFGTLFIDVPCSFAICIIFASISFFLFFVCIRQIAQFFN